MKAFFAILVLFVVLGLGAMQMGVIGIILLAMGVVAAIIAMLIAQYDRQERIEEKLDKLLAARENGETALSADALAESGEDLE